MLITDLERAASRESCRHGRRDRHPHAIASLAFALGLLFGIHSASGQISLPGRAAPAAADGERGSNSLLAESPSKTLQVRLDEARAKLAAESADTSLTNLPGVISPLDLADRRVQLQRLVRLLEQQLSSTAEVQTVKRRREQLERESQSAVRLAESPPYSVLLTDRLREGVQTERLKIANGEAAVSTMDQLLAESRLALTRAEEKIRQLNEQVEGTKDPIAVARLSWQRDLERLRSQVAAASMGVFDTERQLRQETQAESRTRLGLLERQRVVAEADAGFTRVDLDRVTAQIEINSHQLERELNEAQTRWASATQALAVAREELRASQNPPGANAAATARATEEVAAREAQLETAQASMRILRLLLEIENVERTMWELRYASHNTGSAATLSESERRLAALTRRASLWRDYQQQQLAVSPSQIQLQEARVRSLAPDSDLLPLAREHLATLRQRDELLLRLTRRLDQIQRLSQRWAEGLRTAERGLPFPGRVQALFSGAGSFLQKLWTFELLTAEDTITVEGQKITGKRSITLGKIVMAIMILAVGIWITGLVSRVSERIIIRRLKVEANQARLIRRWVRALMIVCLVMFSLVSVKIPLTVFAFAGGALAIGLGFGLQNLLKNFVSGLILLFERPFRVGDVLDVGGQRGTVTEVGLRASVLQLWDGTETLIPNSSLLENNVTNWTYSNRRVRFAVSVGVDYASDPRRVSQVLNEVAERHGLVEKEPKPQVLFTEFSDSSLVFELRFWVDISTANAAQVSSDLRQMIAGSFAEHGIVIAFPQRDIRLHPVHPIPVEVVTAASRGGATGKNTAGAEAGQHAIKPAELPDDKIDSQPKPAKRPASAES